MNIRRVIKENSFVNLVLFSQIITAVSIVLDIPIIRQIYSFMSITIIPGYLILRRLKINFDDVFNLIVVSIGLSIFYLMFIGLLINQILPVFNINNPLSNLYVLSIFILLNIILAYINQVDKNQENINTYNISEFINNNRNISLFTIFIFITNIFLNILGYIYSYNLIYIILIFNIVFLYIFIIYKFEEENKNLYYLLIYIISLSLLLQTVLTSKYTIGSDISIEYYVFQITKNNKFWDPFFFSENVWIGIFDYNSMLSVTILPTIYSIFLNIKEDFIFKILYTFILSLIPLTLSKIYNNYLNRFSYYSFLSILFYLSDNTIFYGVGPVSLCKQIAAIFFISLFFLVLSMDNIKTSYKKILLILFGFSVNISHYATSYIFLFLVFCIFIINKYIFKDKIDLSFNIVLIIISTKIIWDSFVTIHAINQVYKMFSVAYNRLISDLINPEARSGELTMIYRRDPSIIFILHRLIFYVVHMLLSLGVMTIFINRKENNIKNIYKIVSLLCFSIIITVVLVPVISNWFGLSRFRWVSMLFLTPFIIVGYNVCIYILHNITDIRLVNFSKFHFSSYKIIYKSLISALLISYFLFNVGYVNYYFNDKPLSFTFDSDRMEKSSDPEVVSYYHAQYKQEWDVRSARWFSKNAEPESVIYSDYTSAWHVLVSQAQVNNERVDHLRNNTIMREGEYIYISYLTTVRNVIPVFRSGMSNNRLLYNASLLSPVFNLNNKIYSNGFSDIYLCTSNDDNVIVYDEEFLETL